MQIVPVPILVPFLGLLDLRAQCLWCSPRGYYLRLDDEMEGVAGLDGSGLIEVEGGSSRAARVCRRCGVVLSVLGGRLFSLQSARPYTSYKPFTV